MKSFVAAIIGAVTAVPVWWFTTHPAVNKLWSSPKVEIPKVEAPKIEAPKIEPPKVEAPKKEQPKKDEPPKKEDIPVISNVKPLTVIPTKKPP